MYTFLCSINTLYICFIHLDRIDYNQNMLKNDCNCLYRTLNSAILYTYIYFPIIHDQGESFRINFYVFYTATEVTLAFRMPLRKRMSVSVLHWNITPSPAGLTCHNDTLHCPPLPLTYKVKVINHKHRGK